MSAAVELRKRVRGRVRVGVRVRVRGREIARVRDSVRVSAGDYVRATFAGDGDQG